MHIYLNSKDQKGSFGLTVTQHDNGIWVQSVQPHGAADQVFKYRIKALQRTKFTLILFFSSKIFVLVIN